MFFFITVCVLGLLRVQSVSAVEETSIIVKYKEDLCDDIVKNTCGLGCYKEKTFEDNLMEVWRVPVNSVDEYVDKLSENNMIDFVQKDYKLGQNCEMLKSSEGTYIESSNTAKMESGKFEIGNNSYLDSYYEYQWGIRNTGQNVLGDGIEGIDAKISQAWQMTKGSPEIVVGVLDSGIDVSNSNLVGNVYCNNKEIPNNGIDDDQNGYIDDYQGWDFCNGDASVYDSMSEDCHGTYIAGIIAANDNGKGIVGVAPNVKVMPLKFMDSQRGGDTSKAIEAILYAKKMGVRVINCSWSGEECNPALKDVMEKSGIVFICSAGNKGINIDINPVYPACFESDNIITVGSINNRGEISKFSNIGKNVDVLAPGEAIVSILPEENYIFSNGTSASAAFVTGELALAMSYCDRLQLDDIKKQICKSVDVDKDKYISINSEGRIDAYKLLLNIK